MPRKTRGRTDTWKVTGRLQRTSPRYGFVMPEASKDDIYVPSRHLSGALDGDEVEVEVRRSLRSGLLEGRIIRVIHRPSREITGVVAKSRYGYVLLPDSSKFPAPIVVTGDKSAVFGEGDRVVATLSGRERGDVNRCKVLRVLGDSEDARLDSVIVAIEMGIPMSFGERALAEAGTMAESDGEPHPELREHVIFTIDPAEAHDFDDAVSVRELSRDRFEVGVHIADVSSYVEDGGAVDIEAMERGNSVYLPDTVFPMLPHRISNELCSLGPGKPKRCLTTLMEMTRDGRVLRSRFLETTIMSQRRFTYEEVQSVLDGKTKAPREIETALKTLNTIAEALKEQRGMRGSVELELPEVRARLSVLGETEELYLQQRTGSHSLIEELMVLANTVIGVRMKEAGVPFIYRIHPAAKREKTEDFLRAAKVIGVPDTRRLKKEFRVWRETLGDSLDVHRKRLLDYLFIRSMEKARYDINDVGHYGLGLEGYCHFTSPIRRYPDLLDHRIVKRCLIRRGKGLPRELESKLPVAAELCSERETRADAAEREAMKIKSLRHMKQFLGEVFDGLIVGVVNSGFFVEITDRFVEGMVSKEALRDDSYSLDEENFALVGSRKGKRYSLGQSVKVQIARVVPLSRTMDLVPVRDSKSELSTRRRERRRR